VTLGRQRNDLSGFEDRHCIIGDANYFVAQGGDGPKTTA
jgi:hypothetical protein